MIKVYLMCPYSHKRYHVRQSRVLLASRTAAYLMRQGYCVYSPLSHSDQIAHHIENHLDHDFWLRQCRPFVEWADEVHLILADGWDKSRGIALELEWAKELGKPVHYINPE